MFRMSIGGANREINGRAIVLCSDSLITDMAPSIVHLHRFSGVRLRPKRVGGIMFGLGKDSLTFINCSGG